MSIPAVEEIETQKLKELEEEVSKVKLGIV